MHAILLFRIFSRLLLNQSFRLSAFGIFFFFAVSLLLLLLLLLPRSLSASSSHRFDSLNYNQYVCDYEYHTRYCPPVLILFFKIIRYTIFAILSLNSHTLFHSHTLFSSSYVFFYLLLLLFHGHWNFVRFLLFNFFFLSKTYFLSFLIHTHSELLWKIVSVPFKFFLLSVVVYGFHCYALYEN